MQTQKKQRFNFLCIYAAYCAEFCQITIELQLNHKSSVLFDVISWPGPDELVVNCTNIMMYVRLQTIINALKSREDKLDGKKI